MSRKSLGVVSGLFVMALGVFAVTGLLRPEEAPVEAEPAASPTPAPVSTVDSPSVSIAPELAGVPARITRVLEWNGDAGFAREDELAQLPPKVAAVLTQYGVALRIPVTEEGG
jgi:hypothetical protein